jgi:4-amino-4-deoxy-L-arabinose transferase-like glycosyltransferase
MLKARTLTTLIFLSLCCVLILLLSIETLTLFVSDDAYYYLNVARNIVRGAGSTFDGMDPTNGYHPLWMLCLLPVYWLFGSSTDIALRATLVLQALMVAATLWLAWDAFRRFSANILCALVAVALVCTLFSPMQMMFNGLETDLVILMLVLLVHADAKYSYLGTDHSAGQQAALGLLLGLLVLARLDEAFLVIGIALWSILRPQPLSWVRRIMSLCRAYWLTVLVFAAVIVPYFAWNWVQFGHLAPISGTLKATFPHPNFRPDVLVSFAPYVIATLLAGLALVPMHRHPDGAVPAPNLDLLTGLWVGCLIQVGWAVLFTSWGTFQWHFAAHIPVSCFILACYVRRLAVRPSVGVTAGVALALALGVVAFNVFVYNDKGDYHAGAYTAATWARTQTPPDTVFALRDAGVFGYFSERRTINLDGLINSYEYQYYVREGRVMDFLRERHVAYLADAFSPCDYNERNVWVRSYLPPRPPETVAYGLAVTRPIEAYRSEDSVYRPMTLDRPMCFVVWPFDRVRLKLRDPKKALIRH